MNQEHGLHGNVSRAQGKFQAVDTNGDGKISETEMEEHETQRGKQTSDRFRRTDTDDDGVISPEEFVLHEREQEARRRDASE